MSISKLMTINRYLKYILLFFIVFCSTIFNIHAADKKTQLADSVQNLLNNKSLPDSLRIIHLAELALMDYYLEMDNTQANNYLSDLQKIGDEYANQDLQVFIYATKIQMANDLEGIKRVIDSCIFYTEKAKDPFIRSIGWQALGKIKRNTPLAFEYIERALNEIEGRGYWLQEQSLYYDLIHNCYAVTETYPQAIDYAQLSLDAAEKSGNNYIIAKSWAELGVSYLMNSDLAQESDSLLNLSYTSFMHVLHMYRDDEVDLSVRSNQLLYNTALINLANIETIRGNTDQVILYLQQALDISLEYDKSENIDYNMKPYVYYTAKLNIIQCYTKLSNLYKSLGKYKEAEKYLLSAIEFLPRTHLDDIRNGTYPAYRITISLADLYYEMGRYEDAVQRYISGYEQYRDYYAYNVDGIAEHLEKAYEKERKKQEINILQESLSQNRKNIVLFTLFIAFLLMTSIALYFLQKYRLKGSIQRRKLYEHEKKILETLKEKKQIEARLNTYETEKYKRQLLTENLLVEHKSKVIEELRGFFKNNPSLNKYKEELEQILTSDNPTEEEVNDFNASFQGIDHILYKQLQEYTDNKLTPLDLKYCHMIQMKMSSKEMAEMLHVDTGTIRVNKYRLKQKFKLGKGQDLASFIEKIHHID